MTSRPPSLTVYHELPAGILQCSAQELHEYLPGPSLIHLNGHRQPPLFISVLLHGNEHSGLTAIQQLLVAYSKKPLPRALSLFIGNVTAARDGLRKLPDGADFNRVWLAGKQPEHAITRQVCQAMQQRGVFASIDIHNNSGLNPHYACVNRLHTPFLQLATLFSRTVVYFTRPEGVQSAAFARLCPAVTIECGQPGNAAGIDHAIRFCKACLQLDHMPEQAVKRQDIALFHTVATVRVAAGLSFCFDRQGNTDIEFVDGIEAYNFTELEATTPLARLRHGISRPLQAIDERGQDVSEQFFYCQQGQLFSRRVFMPSMLTTDIALIEQDCLCYLMERYPLPQMNTGIPQK